MLDTREVFAGISSEWKVPEDLPFFDGHFPGQPVVPAVAIVDASLELLRARLKIPALAVQTIQTAKFMQPIGPGMTVNIALKEVRPLEWDIEWSSQGKKLAQIRLQVAEERD